MKSKAPAFQHYPKDAIVDTRHLEGDAFKALWMLSWQSWLGFPGYPELPQCHIPNDDATMRKFSGLDQRQWRRVKDEVMGLFRRAEDGASFYSKRLLEELAKQQERVKAGRSGGVAKASNGLANVKQNTKQTSSEPASKTLANGCLPIPSSSSSPRSTDPEEESTSVLLPGRWPGDFLRFYSAYPRKVGKAKALKAWKQTAKSRPPIDSLLARLELLKASGRWRENGGEFVPYPATWLNRAGWEDEPETFAARGADGKPEPTYRYRRLE